MMNSITTCSLKFKNFSKPVMTMLPRKTLRKWHKAWKIVLEKFN